MFFFRSFYNFLIHFDKINILQCSIYPKHVNFSSLVLLVRLSQNTQIISIVIRFSWLIIKICFFHCDSMILINFITSADLKWKNSQIKRLGVINLEHVLSRIPISIMRGLSLKKISVELPKRIQRATLLVPDFNKQLPFNVGY